MLIDDGRLECRVTSIRGKSIVADVMVGGTVTSHKGINLPHSSVRMDSLTKKDREDLALAIREGVDFVALSFVRTAKDITALRKLLPARKPAIHILAKIEQHEALTNFEEILDAADGILIARGDLALESDAAHVPIAQKECVAKARRAAKPIIVATQMLDSMERNPRPTRAEISDVANAVIDHTDAVMLSGETASGNYPVRAVETMASIIEQTENSPYDDVPLTAELGTLHSKTAAIAALAALSATLTGSKALIAFTHSGNVGRLLAHFRSEIPMVMGASSARVANQLALVWGLNHTLVIPNARTPKTLFETLTSYAARTLKLKKGAAVIRAAASATSAARESMIEIRKI